MSLKFSDAVITPPLINEKRLHGTEHGRSGNTFTSISFTIELHANVSFGGILQDVIKVFRPVFFLRRSASDVVFQAYKH